MQPQQTQFDIIILGGGISGSVMAISLLKKKSSLKILILEKSNEFPQKVGESTSDITALFFRRFGIDHILKNQIQKTGLRFLFNEKNSLLSEDVAEFSSPTFDGPNNGFQLNRKIFDEELLNEAAQLGAQVYRPAEIMDSTFSPFKCELSVLHKNTEVKVTAKWFVDASGRSRFIHAKLSWKDLPCVLKTGAVFAHFKHINSPENWNIPKNQYWKKNAVGDGSYSTLHFMRANRWWWLIRIDENTTSIGVVFDKEEVQFDDVELFFTDQLNNDPQLSTVTKGSNRTKTGYIETVPYQSEKLFDRGIALIGDSGAFVDPLVSPGIELICQQAIWLSELISADIATNQFEEKKWLKYNNLFTRAYKDRMEIYKNAYRLMKSYDLSSNWLQLGLFAYFGILVFFAFTFPKRLKIPFTIGAFGRLGFRFMVWRLNRINRNRMAQNRVSIAGPNAITYSGFRYPKGILHYTIPARMFFRWLYGYLKLEIKELPYLFRNSKKKSESKTK